MTDDPARAKALARYQIISAYIALDPPRGERTALLDRLAARPWTGPDGAPMQPAPETLRRWVRLYRRGGLDALADAPRRDRGATALTPEQVETACALKTEIPARSLDRILKIMRAKGHLEPGAASRSTLHRALQKRGLSAGNPHGWYPPGRGRTRYDRPGARGRPRSAWAMPNCAARAPNRQGKIRPARVCGACGASFVRLMMASSGFPHSSEVRPHASEEHCAARCLP